MLTRGWKEVSLTGTWGVPRCTSRSPFGRRALRRSSFPAVLPSTPRTRKERVVDAYLFYPGCACDFHRFLLLCRARFQARSNGRVNAIYESPQSFGDRQVRRVVIIREHAGSSCGQRSTNGRGKIYREKIFPKGKRINRSRGNMGGC